MDQQAYYIQILSGEIDDLREEVQALKRRIEELERERKPMPGPTEYKQTATPLPVWQGAP